MKRLRTLLGIGLGLAIVAGAGWYISQGLGTAKLVPRAGRSPPGAGGPGGRGHGRQGRYSRRAAGTGHRDAAPHRQRQDPDHRPAHRGPFQGRPDGQAGRPAGRGRSASLRRRPAAGDRPACSATRPCSRTPRPTSNATEAGRPGLDRAPAARHPAGLPGAPVRGGAGHRPGAGRRRQAQRHLHEDRRAADRPHRPAHGRQGQLRDDGRRDAASASSSRSSRSR